MFRKKKKKYVTLAEVIQIRHSLQKCKENTI